jgi:hypothetical protein
MLPLFFLMASLDESDEDDTARATGGAVGHLLPCLVAELTVVDEADVDVVFVVGEKEVGNAGMTDATAVAAASLSCRDSGKVTAVLSSIDAGNFGEE